MRSAPGNCATGTPSCAPVMNFDQIIAGTLAPEACFVGALESLPTQTPAVRFAV